LIFEVVQPDSGNFWEFDFDETPQGGA
jgi:hypothetical protein